MSMTDCSMKNINVGQSQAKIKHMLGFSHTGQQHLLTKEKCEWLGVVVRGRLLLPGEIDYKGLHGVATALLTSRLLWLVQ